MNEHHTEQPEFSAELKQAARTLGLDPAELRAARAPGWEEAYGEAGMSHLTGWLIRGAALAGARLARGEPHGMSGLHELPLEPGALGQWLTDVPAAHNLSFPAQLLLGRLESLRRAGARLYGTEFSPLPGEGASAALLTFPGPGGLEVLSGLRHHDAWGEDDFQVLRFAGADEAPQTVAAAYSGLGFEERLILEMSPEEISEHRLAEVRAELEARAALGQLLITPGTLLDARLGAPRLPATDQTTTTARGDYHRAEHAPAGLVAYRGEDALEVRAHWPQGQAPEDWAEADARAARALDARHRQLGG